MTTYLMAGIHSSPVLQPAEADAPPGRNVLGSANCCNEVESSLQIFFFKLLLQKLKSAVNDAVDVVALLLSWSMLIPTQ